MEWSDVTLTTPQSIARYEKEINVIDKPAVERVFIDGDIDDIVYPAGTTTTFQPVSRQKGFGKLAIEAADLDGTVTVKLYESDTEAGDYIETGISVTLDSAVEAQQKTVEFLLPVSIADYIKLKFTRSSSATGTIKVTLKSAWDDKHLIAKDMIANVARNYIDDLDELTNPTELSVAANYLVLHLIYADLLIGYGESEVYMGKMKFYYQQYDKQIRSSINRLKIDTYKIKADAVLVK